LGYIQLNDNVMWEVIEYLLMKPVSWVIIYMCMHITYLPIVKVIYNTILNTAYGDLVYNEHN